MKDNFSSQSDQYAKYRLSYPLEFFEYIYSLVPNTQCAWDCGTGNGQVAFELAKNFDTVYATDISQQQLSNALQAPNINYSVQPAESTNFSNQQFDLITIAQAIHWFDFEKFYSEVKRTAKHNAVICAVGYEKVDVSENVNTIIENLYSNTLGDYWDKERKYIDEQYATIPFPFEEIKPPLFEITVQWTVEHLIGYLNTWSAVKHFIRKNGYNPVDTIKNSIEQNWGTQRVLETRFPLIIRLGRIHK